jgi:uncharacterized protein YggE
MPRSFRLITVLIAGISTFLMFSSSSILAQNRNPAQSQSFENHVITVSRGGTAYAKPDLGILVMTIRSSAPIADEAVAQNGQKAKAVEAALGGMGFSSTGYKITSVTFGQAGGPRFGPMQPAITAYDATQYVYVFFEAADLNDVAKLTEKCAAVIEALRKSGAVPAEVGGPRLPTMQGALIVYTIKDPAPYEKQALQEAIGRARDAAQDVAVGTGVKITGLRNVSSNFLSGNDGQRSGDSSLAGLTYRWYSGNSDSVEIGASATVDYDFK